MNNLGLIGTIQLPIGHRATLALRRLEEQDLMRVVRVTHAKLAAADETPFLTEAEAEASLQQYYALPVLFPEYRELAVSRHVDQYWHNHIIDTRAYRRLCQQVYGRFMDHVPLDKSDVPEAGRVAVLYAETRALLGDAFGKHVSERAYPLRPTSDIVICTYDYE